MTSDTSLQQFPTLASALLSQQRTHLSTTTTAGYKTGIKALDRALAQTTSTLPSTTLFPAECIVGFGGVDDKHTHALTLIHALIATHLLTTPDSASTTSVFIIEPPTLPPASSSLLGIYDILSTRVSKQPLRQDSNSNVDDLMDRISLLPCFDLIGVSQALTEVDEAVKSSSEIDGNQGRGTVLLLRGMGELLAGSGTASGYGVSARPFALLSLVARQMRRLVKSGVLVLIEVGVGEGMDGVHLSSAFSSVDGRGLRLGLGVGGEGGSGNGSGRREGVVSEGLARVLEERMDVLLVVHGGFGIVNGEGEGGSKVGEQGRCIVEIVKDEVASGLGNWAVWDGET